jgi:hypothetical protein
MITGAFFSRLGRSGVMDATGAMRAGRTDSAAGELDRGTESRGTEDCTTLTDSSLSG